ncbi:hypothetical protein ACHAXA_006697 [Cyclostephanos tholiformis]|uniref:Uncharacterized protein n=1 Tax=Cyclostephanos tholiformis TaxID=382380 RepID=A0ABD3RF02_9STRA
MPFFHSLYLKDAKVKAQPNRGSLLGGPSRSGISVGAKPSTANNNQRRPVASRLIWHSNTGSSGLRGKGAQNNYKPLNYNADGKKVVHFSTIEVRQFHFDWSLADQVFYTRKELAAMGQNRFDDADLLRRQRRLDGGGDDGQRTVDDVGTSKKSKDVAIADLLSLALSDEDRDEDVSIRGIEHFVYPDLQQEMIRRKKTVQREVMDFVRARRPDPQGWRLAEHSRTYSQWARNVALEKGMKYCMNNAAVDPEVNISQDELDRCRRSTDELESYNKSLRGSASFSAPSEPFDSADDRQRTENLRKIAECERTDGDEEEGDQYESGEPSRVHESLRPQECEQSPQLDEGEKSSQPAGADTGED